MMSAKDGMAGRGGRRRWRALAGLLGLLSMLGCGNFFVKPGTGGSTGGGGTGSGTSLAYVLNQTTQTVAGFVVGAGTLTAVPSSPYSLGSVPQAEVVSQNNAFLYLAGPGSINAYTIATSGAITQATCSGCAVIADVVSLDVSPDGQWLFGLDLLTSTIDLWQLDSSTGAMTAAVGAPFSVTSGTVTPRQVRVSPAGNVVVAALGTGGDAAFTFDTSTGAFAPAGGNLLATGSTQTSDNALAINSAGTVLYIARSGTNGGVAAYAIGSDGSLSGITGSPFAAGGTPAAVQLDGTGAYLYAANRVDGTVSGYSIGTGGGLTALAGSPFASGSLVNSLALDGTGTYVLAAALNGSPDLTLYSFSTATSGALVSAATATTGTDPTGATVVATTH